jgi:hypothetical protein
MSGAASDRGKIHNSHHSRRVEQAMQSVSVWQYYLGLAILLILLTVAVVKSYGMWEEIHDVEEPDSPTDLLEAFEEAHAAGELDDAELERVRRRLAGTPPPLPPNSPAPTPEPGTNQSERPSS